MLLLHVELVWQRANAWHIVFVVAGRALFHGKRLLHFGTSVCGEWPPLECRRNCLPSASRDKVVGSQRWNVSKNKQTKHAQWLMTSKKGEWEGGGGGKGKTFLNWSMVACLDDALSRWRKLNKNNKKKSQRKSKQESDFVFRVFLFYVTCHDGACLATIPSKSQRIGCGERDTLCVRMCTSLVIDR